MRITWIRVATDLPEHPKSKLLELELGERNAWAYVARLWMWCSNYAQDGRIPNRMVGIAEKASGWAGEEGRLFSHLLSVGFLEAEPGVWVAHKWDEHQGAAIRQAEHDAVRKKRFREAKRKEREHGEAESTVTQKCDADGDVAATRTSPSPSGDPATGPSGDPATRTSKVPDLTGPDLTGPDETKSFNRKIATRRPPQLPAPLRVERPTLPEPDWLGQDFQQWAQFKRQEAKLVPEDPLPIHELEAWWAGVRRLIGTQVRPVQRAFIAFGEDPHWQKEKPPLPFRAFVSQWRKYMPQLEEAASA